MVDVLTRTLAETDPAIHAAVQQELLRQQDSAAKARDAADGLPPPATPSRTPGIVRALPGP